MWQPPFSVGEGSWGHNAAISSVFMPAVSGLGFQKTLFYQVQKLCVVMHLEMCSISTCRA